MANVIGSASVSMTLTPSPASRGSTYDVTSSVSMTVTPSPAAQLVAQAHAATGIYLFVTEASRAAFPKYTDGDGQKQTVVIEEAFKSRQIRQALKSTTYERMFFIHGTYDPTKCIDLGPQVGDADDLIPQMLVTNRTLEEHARGGGYSDIVALSVQYAEIQESQSSGADAEANFTYDYSSEDEHVDVAIAQVNYTPVGEATKAGEELLINFDGNEVQGLDVQSPILEFTEEHSFPGESDAFHQGFTPEYRRTLRDCVESVNSATFREFARGEVFLAAITAQKRERRWYVSFRFRVRKNFTAKEFTIYNKNGGAEVVKVDKLGWQYLWVTVARRPLLDNTDLHDRVAPSAVHVADVYSYIDFAVLGIGVKPMT